MNLRGFISGFVIGVLAGILLIHFGIVTTMRAIQEAGLSPYDCLLMDVECPKAEISKSFIEILLMGGVGGVIGIIIGQEMLEEKGPFA